MMTNISREYIVFELPFIVCQTIYIIFNFFAVGMKTIVIGKRRSQRNRRKWLILCGFIGFLMYAISKITLTPRFTFINENVKSKCIIPDLNPFDESVMQFNKNPDPIVCDQKPSLVFVDDEGFLRYNEEAIKKTGIEGLQCKYSVVERQNDNDDYVNLRDSMTFKPPMKVDGDFFRVQCKDKNSRNVYDTLHLQVDYKTLMDKKEVKSETNDKFSVIIFGIDAVSRLAAIRKLPKTHKFMKEDMEAYELRGYMKTGDNTLPNVLAMLAGKQVLNHELPKLDYNKDHFDGYPLIWNNFSDAGYATFFNEDSPDIGAFNLNKQGFLKQPTDHYMRPFWRGIKKIDPVGTLLNDALMGFEDKKMGFKKTSTLCYGNTPKHVLSINFFKEFVKRYKKKLRFGFTWMNEISHNYINFLGLGDNDFYDFFKWMNDNGHFENTFVILLSDHGSRIDLIRNTYVGRIEERMPMMLFSVPEKLKKQYPTLAKNMAENSDRLTTHFDLYETLVDILKSKYETTLKFQGNGKPPRGISLFNSIPGSRSCEDAGVPEHFCACYGSKELKVTEPIVQKVADFALHEINVLVSQRSDVCVKLSLHKIKQAQKIELGLNYNGEFEFFSVFNYFEKPEDQKDARYLVLIETVPGHALLEATIQLENGYKMKLLDEVSRTNLYGTQSICVKENDQLKKYCFCKEQTS